MLQKKEIAITLFKCVTALFLIIMFYKTTTQMILSKEKENSPAEGQEKVTEVAVKENVNEKLIGIDVKNIKGPSYSLYFLAVFLGLAWNVKKVIKIGIC
jgi:hypothetical protein